jgi:hypothetical protein
MWGRSSCISEARRASNRARLPGLSQEGGKTGSSMGWSASTRLKIRVHRRPTAASLILRLRANWRSVRCWIARIKNCCWAGTKQYRGRRHTKRPAVIAAVRSMSSASIRDSPTRSGEDPLSRRQVEPLHETSRDRVSRQRTFPGGESSRPRSRRGVSLGVCWPTTHQLKTLWNVAGAERARPKHHRVRAGEWPLNYPTGRYIERPAGSLSSRYDCRRFWHLVILTRLCSAWQGSGTSPAHFPA